MVARLASLDPRQWGSDAARSVPAEKIFPLVFERLFSLDESGRPQPALATAWQHDAEFKRWQFRLRSDVKFHDGATLTPPAVVSAWETFEGRGRRLSVSADSLVVEFEQPRPDLPAELARSRDFVFRIAADGRVVGTGPFRMAEPQPGNRLLLSANEDYWGGRPFLDSIVVEFGVSPGQQLIDLVLGKADLVELQPEQVRRAMQEGRRVWSSAPVELFALVFDRQRPAVQDERLRHALALSVDRASIANVLLQKQAEVAGGLLPQWLSGYAFLFSAAPDPVRARELRAEVPPVAALALSYDSSDALARAVGERIVVNAREAGINLQVSPQGSAQAAPGDVRLIRARLAVARPQGALSELMAALGLPEASGTQQPATPEQVYAAERALLELFQVVPVVHLTESDGLGSAVRNWMPRRWGAWRLEEIWLDTAAAASTHGDGP
jgi:peptide/nickel transport system substrate-binding protein